jgi:hypothetical protein
MDKSAYDNLKLLDNKYDESLYLINDNNILSLIEKDSFDTCSNIHSLEYPIYFTYHQILNIVDYDNDISYSKKQDLLDKIENSFDNLIDYLEDYEDYEQNNENLSFMIDDIYERIDIIKKKIKYNYFEKFIYLFDEIVDGFRSASKYLYFSPRPYDILYDMNPGDFYEPQDELCLDSDNDEDNNSDNDSDNDSDKTVSEDDTTDTEDNLSDDGTGVGLSNKLD